MSEVVVKTRKFKRNPLLSRRQVGSCEVVIIAAQATQQLEHEGIVVPWKAEKACFVLK